MKLLLHILHLFMIVYSFMLFSLFISALADNINRESPFGVQSSLDQKNTAPNTRVIVIKTVVKAVKHLEPASDAQVQERGAELKFVPFKSANMHITKPETAENKEYEAMRNIIMEQPVFSNGLLKYTTQGKDEAGLRFDSASVPQDLSMFFRKPAFYPVLSNENTSEPFVLRRNAHTGSRAFRQKTLNRRVDEHPHGYYEGDSDREFYTRASNGKTPLEDVVKGKVGTVPAQNTWSFVFKVLMFVMFVLISLMIGFYLGMIHESKNYMRVEVPTEN